MKDVWVDLLNTSMNHAAVAAGYPIAQETELTRIDDLTLRSMVREGERVKCRMVSDYWIVLRRNLSCWELVYMILLR